MLFPFPESIIFADGCASSCYVLNIPTEQTTIVSIRNCTEIPANVVLTKRATHSMIIFCVVWTQCLTTSVSLKCIRCYGPTSVGGIDAETKPTYLNAHEAKQEILELDLPMTALSRFELDPSYRGQYFKPAFDCRICIGNNRVCWHVPLWCQRKECVYIYACNGMMSCLWWKLTLNAKG